MAGQDPPKFRILGPLEVTAETGVLMPIRRHQHRAALTALLLCAGHICPRSWLLGMLWGTQPPPSGATALRTVIYGLRRELGAHAGRLRTGQAGPQPGGYLMEAQPCDVDIHVFRGMADTGRAAWYRGEAGQADRILGHALRLWRGRPLADLPATPAAVAESGRLLSEFRDVQDTWIDARLALGHYRAVGKELRDVLAREPYREHTWAQLMTALSGCGDVDGALRAFSIATTVLAEEYGSGPGPELIELRRQILAGSPTLFPSVIYRRRGHPGPGA